MDFFEGEWMKYWGIVTLSYVGGSYGMAWFVYYIYYQSSAKKRLHSSKIQKEYTSDKILKHELKLSFVTLLMHVIEGGIVIWFATHGYTLIYSDISEYGIAYFIGSIIAMILLHDAYFYWTHRLMHVKWIYPAVHKFHHKSLNPSPWAAFSQTPWEAAIAGLIFIVFAWLFPTHWLALSFFVLYMTVMNIMGHNGFEVYPKGFSKSWFGKWNTTVTHHNMHHKYFHGNFGLYFNFWDRWMGTEREDYHENYDATFEKSDS
ncbi:MAG: sterol desaturase family protein [Reichenbachiella sp.]